MRVTHAAICGSDLHLYHGMMPDTRIGHTFGHAIESATNYSSWLHGEAVGAGMLLAADMSQRLGWVGAADVTRIERATGQRVVRHVVDRMDRPARADLQGEPGIAGQARAQIVDRPVDRLGDLRR